MADDTAGNLVPRAQDRTRRRVRAHDHEPDTEARGRFTIRLAGDAGLQVRRMAQQKGVTVNEFIRQAIGTEVYLQQKHSEGARILLEDKEKTLREIVIR